MQSARGDVPGASLDPLQKRLEELRGFRQAAQEELDEAGGIDPELKIEIKQLDEAIRNTNIAIFTARGNRIKTGKRERCTMCHRLLPVGVSAEEDD